MLEYTENKEIIARRIALFFSSGDVVNLGIGLPTLVGNFVPREVTVILQSENGMMGLGPMPEKGKEDKDLTNAGGVPVTVLAETQASPGSKQTHASVWVPERAKGRTVAIALGHDGRVRGAPEFNRLLLNAVVWTNQP